MRSLLHLFYRLPMGLILWGAWVSTIVFLEIRRRHQTRAWFRISCGLLMILWVYVLLQLTILHRPPGSCTDWYVIPLRFLWEMYTTGNTELVRTMFMNAALFYPAGLLTALCLPRDWSRRRCALTVCGIFLAVSGAVELTQFFLSSGRAEMDDVLFNVTGAYLGALPILKESKK